MVSIGDLSGSLSLDISGYAASLAAAQQQNAAFVQAQADMQASVAATAQTLGALAAAQSTVASASQQLGAAESAVAASAEGSSAAQSKAAFAAQQLAASLAATDEALAHQVSSEEALTAEEQASIAARNARRMSEDDTNAAIARGALILADIRAQEQEKAQADQGLNEQEKQLASAITTTTKSIDDQGRSVQQTIQNLTNGNAAVTTAISGTNALGQATTVTAKATGELGPALQAASTGAQSAAGGLTAAAQGSVTLGQGLSAAQPLLAAFGISGQQTSAAVALLGSTSLASVAGIAALAVGVAAVGTALVSQGSSLQNAEAQLAGYGNISTQTAQQIGTAFLSSGQAAQFSAAQEVAALAPVAAILQDATGRTLSAADAQTVMSASMGLAATTGTSLAASTSAVATTLRTYGEDVSQASAVSAVLYNTSRETGAGIDQLTQVFGRLHDRLGPLAPSLNETGGLLDQFAEHGLTGQRGLQAVQTGLENLLNPSKAVQTELTTLGVSIYDGAGNLRSFGAIMDQLVPALSGMGDQARIAAEQAIFGKTQWAAWDDVIKSGIDTMHQHAQAAGDVTTAQKAQAEQAATLTASWNELKSAGANLAAEFGGPVVEGLAALSGGMLTAVKSGDQLAAKFSELNSSSADLGVHLHEMIAGWISDLLKWADDDKAAVSGAGAAHTQFSTDVQASVTAAQRTWTASAAEMGGAADQMKNGLIGLSAEARANAEAADTAASSWGTFKGSLEGAIDAALKAIPAMGSLAAAVHGIGDAVLDVGKIAASAGYGDSLEAANKRATESTKEATAAAADEKRALDLESQATIEVIKGHSDVAGMLRQEAQAYRDNNVTLAESIARNVQVQQAGDAQMASSVKSATSQETQYTGEAAAAFHDARMAEIQGNADLAASFTALGNAIQSGEAGSVTAARESLKALQDEKAEVAAAATVAKQADTERRQSNNDYVAAVHDGNMAMIAGNAALAQSYYDLANAIHSGNAGTIADQQEAIKGLQNLQSEQKAEESAAKQADTERRQSASEYAAAVHDGNMAMIAGKAALAQSYYDLANAIHSGAAGTIADQQMVIKGLQDQQAEQKAASDLVVKTVADENAAIHDGNMARIAGNEQLAQSYFALASAIASGDAGTIQSQQTQLKLLQDIQSEENAAATATKVRIASQQSAEADYTTTVKAMRADADSYDILVTNNAIARHKDATQQDVLNYQAQAEAARQAGLRDAQAAGDAANEILRIDAILQGQLSTADRAHWEEMLKNAKNTFTQLNGLYQDDVSNYQKADAAAIADAASLSQRRISEANAVASTSRALAQSTHDFEAGLLSDTATKAVVTSQAQITDQRGIATAASSAANQSLQAWQTALQQLLALQAQYARTTNDNDRQTLALQIADAQQSVAATRQEYTDKQGAAKTANAQIGQDEAALKAYQKQLRDLDLSDFFFKEDQKIAKSQESFNQQKSQEEDSLALEIKVDGIKADSLDQLASRATSAVDRESKAREAAEIRQEAQIKATEAAQIVSLQAEENAQVASITRQEAALKAQADKDEADYAQSQQRIAEIQAKISLDIAKLQISAAQSVAEAVHASNQSQVDSTSAAGKAITGIVETVTQTSMKASDAETLADIDNLNKEIDAWAAWGQAAIADSNAVKGQLGDLDSTIAGIAQHYNDLISAIKSGAQANVTVLQAQTQATQALAAATNASTSATNAGTAATHASTSAKASDLVDLSFVNEIYKAKTDSTQADTKAIDANTQATLDSTLALDQNRLALDSHKESLGSDKLALDEQKQALDAAKFSLDQQKQALDDAKLSLDAHKQAVDDEKQALSDLQDQLSSATAAYQDLNNATIQGLPEANAQVANAQLAIERRQLADLKGNIDQGTDDELKQLEKKLQILQLTEKVTFDPLTAQLDAVKKGTRELPFDSLISSLTNAKAHVASLSNEYTTQSAALKIHEKSLADETAALATQQKKLDDATAALTTQNQALSDTSAALTTQGQALSNTGTALTTEAQRITTNTAALKDNAGAANAAATAHQNLASVSGGGSPASGGGGGGGVGGGIQAPSQADIAAIDAAIGRLGIAAVYNGNGLWTPYNTAPEAGGHAIGVSMTVAQLQEWAAGGRLSQSASDSVSTSTPATGSVSVSPSPTRAGSVVTNVYIGGQKVAATVNAQNFEDTVVHSVHVP